KYYGDLRALDDVSFDIPDSGIIGFLGPNGAGKTTTLKIITCFMPPTSGTVIVDGMDISQNSIDIRKKIGYLPEGNPIYPEMNVVDFLYFIAKLKNVDEVLIPKRVNQKIKTYGIESVVHKEIGELSKGYRQRVALAGASIHNPEILILDEPTSGLDPNQIVEIRSLIKRLGKEKTILISTHILREIETICDKVIIIDKGKIAADSTLEEIQSSFHNQNQIYFEIESNTNMLIEEFNTIPEIESTQLHSHENGIYKLYVNYEKDADLRPILYNFIKKKDWTLLEMRMTQQSLEDVFRRLTETREESVYE
ncbi:MAG: ATP-binding cassette domain-containing protein, partial [Candidatus Cloacimonadota bacterium]|nr:ATP-binding cassette domain-containing protein [Candidatus Cloacimonadota bacterium]